ncbi:hypothetical protein [Plantactinospora sp. GCM10030261]|uniref:hypothetical protein n=1 Tax=Plantactinospora sp. GCM10030261 TaxID=3273420 RepID=UPI00366C2554
MSPPYRSKQPPAFLAATVSAFLATGLAGCGNDDDDSSRGSQRYVHCIDDNGRVVDPDRCDDTRVGASPFWYYLAARRYTTGAAVPGDHKTSRIDPSNQSARAAAGLPRTGQVGGSTVSSGGFGSGGTSGTKSGGS